MMFFPTQYYFNSGLLKKYQLRLLNSTQYRTIFSYAIYKLIKLNILSLAEALSMDEPLVLAIENKLLYRILRSKKLTIVDLFLLNQNNPQVLGSNALLELLNRDLLTIEIACQLDDEQLITLTRTAIYAIILNKFVSVEFVLKASPLQIKILSSGAIHNLISDKSLSLEQAMLLEHLQFNILSNDIIYGYIQNNKLSIDLALTFSYEHFHKARDPMISLFINENALTIEEALNINLKEFKKLDNEICNLIFIHFLTVDQALNLPHQQKFRLYNPEIILLITEASLNFEEFSELRVIHFQLINQYAREIISLQQNHLMTFAQFISLDSEAQFDVFLRLERARIADQERIATLQQGYATFFRDLPLEARIAQSSRYFSSLGH